MIKKAKYIKCFIKGLSDMADLQLYVSFEKAQVETKQYINNQYRELLRNK